jgi:tricorn protease
MFASFCALAALSAPALAGVDARMLRFPDVSADRIAFVYAGDIWVVSKTGGTAQRLSTPAGEETFPRFSPDGRQLAYSANYDGNTDLYVVAVDGGVPRRLTYHPYPDRMLDWYPDGRSILFASPRTSGTNRFNQLWKISAEGGMPERLPVPYGEFGSISPDGASLAYVPISTDFRTWKRYRGGMNPDIWLFDLKQKTSKNATSDVAADSQPMWHGNTLYFLSDRDANKRANLWAMEGPSGKPRQVTHFEEMDVAFPAMGPKDIVFSVGGELHLLDLVTDSERRVDVDVITDRATLKPRQVQVNDRIVGTGVSPAGKRVLFEARGELFSVPVEHGVTWNLTNSSGVAERTPSWSPDGKWIAYFSDRSGEYELCLRSGDGSGEERVLSSFGPGFRYLPQWSPDSKKIVFVDQAMQILVFDVETKREKKIDKGSSMFHGNLAGFRAAWSADSRWIAWSRGLERGNSSVFLYDTKNAQLHQVTSGFYADGGPTFDPAGKYLFFACGRSFEPSYGDLDNTWIYANTSQLCAVPLRKDVPSPLAPRNDSDAEDKDKKAEKKDEKKEEKKDEKAADTEKSKEEKKKIEPVEIDLDDFERRVVVLPPKAGNYDNLAAVEGKLLYIRRPRTGSGSEDDPIVFYDLEKREEKTVLGKADFFLVAAEGKKILVRSTDKYAVLDIAPDQKLDKTIDLSGMSMELDPVAEWRQMFQDAWRLERDYFYDPNMHGVNWAEMRKRYGALLPHVVTRWDLNYLLGELIAELNASHAYRGGGDTEQPKQSPVGLLGADLELDHGAYRIARIVDGAMWDSEVRSPLARTGVEAKVGDYILAVNGVPIDADKEPWAALQGLAGKTVSLTVNAKPTRDGAHQVLVETLNAESEFRLRNLAWIENNRRKVEEATKGRVGYVYVPSTGLDGQNELVRMWAGQWGREGLIVDERFNSGGQIPDRFVELLNRPLYNFWGVRDGYDWQWPPVAQAGPKAMLINGWSGSGGDCFPYYFRAAKLGPLIGMRTWGGLIGISGSPQLIDGGAVTVPTFGFYALDGKWAVEGHGIDPDIEVVDDPAKMMDGGDPQLERAIREVMSELEAHPVKRPTRIPYPNRAGR